jgi:hypothetical protein
MRGQWLKQNTAWHAADCAPPVNTDSIYGDANSGGGANNNGGDSGTGSNSNSDGANSAGGATCASGDARRGRHFLRLYRHELRLSLLRG